MLSKLAILLILFGSVAYAQDETIVSGGIGISNSGKKSLAETKMLTLSFQEDLWGPLKQRGTLGGWIDNAGGGKTGSALAAAQIGWEIERNGIVASVFSGPCLLSETDILLGGHFQFMDDLHLGIRDVSGYYIGVIYRHISSAGIATPNIGRDIVGLEFRF